MSDSTSRFQNVPADLVSVSLGFARERRGLASEPDILLQSHEESHFQG